LQDTRNDLVPALQVPWTITTTNQRAQFTLAPTVAFFPASNAIAFRRPPVDEPGSFGTTLGLSGGASYQLHRRLAVWGDFFAPITGNNSISRESGKPAKAIAYNAGLRYLVNPQVGLDVFASNTQGGIGPLALTADRDFTAVGTRLAFMPELFQGNRRYGDSWSQDFWGEDVPDTVDGLAFFDGGTVPEGQLTSNLQGGGQGLLAALRYGVVKDLEAGVYLDLVTGDVDESEQGYSVVSGVHCGSLLSWPMCSGGGSRLLALMPGEQCRSLRTLVLSGRWGLILPGRGMPLLAISWQTPSLGQWPFVGTPRFFWGVIPVT